VRTTRSATLPTSTRDTPRRPCVPSRPGRAFVTTRSTISRHGAPPPSSPVTRLYMVRARATSRSSTACAALMKSSSGTETLHVGDDRRRIDMQDRHHRVELVSNFAREIEGFARRRTEICRTRIFRNACMGLLLTSEQQPSFRSLRLRRQSALPRSRCSLARTSPPVSFRSLRLRRQSAPTSVSVLARSHLALRFIPLPPASPSVGAYLGLGARSLAPRPPVSFRSLRLRRQSAPTSVSVLACSHLALRFHSAPSGFIPRDAIRKRHPTAGPPLPFGAPRDLALARREPSSRKARPRARPNHQRRR